MNINLTKPSYTFTFAPEQIAVIHAALLELPAKLSLATIETIVQQVQRQEQPQIQPVESANVGH